MTEIMANGKKTVRILCNLPFFFLVSETLKTMRSAEELDEIYLKDFLYIFTGMCHSSKMKPTGKIASPLN